MAVKFAVDIKVIEKGKGGPKWNINSDIDGQYTLKELMEFTKESLIVITDEAVREEQSRGFEKSPIYVVDGRANKKVIDVNPFGKIEVFSKIDVEEIVTWAYQSIHDRSPVLTGRYKSSNFVFWNGKQVATDLQGLLQWLQSKPDFKDTDKIRIVNIAPYARRLERLGIRAGTEAGQNIGRSRTVKSRSKKAPEGTRVLAPNGAYYLSYRSVLNRFKRNAGIKFTFISGSELGFTDRFKSASNRSRGKIGRNYLYPTIVISVSGSGSNL